MHASVLQWMDFYFLIFLKTSSFGRNYSCIYLFVCLPIRGPSTEGYFASTRESMDERRSI